MEARKSPRRFPFGTLTSEEIGDLLLEGREPMEVLAMAVLRRALADLETGRYAEWGLRKANGSGPQVEWRAPIKGMWFCGCDCAYWCEVAGIEWTTIQNLAEQATQKRRQSQRRSAHTSSTRPTARPKKSSSES